MTDLVDILQVKTAPYASVISSRTHFELQGRCIIEKLVIDRPCRLTIEFPREACYLFLREGALIVNGTNTKTHLEPKDGIALNCGSYFADFVEGLTSHKSEVIAIHLHSDVLHDIFQAEIPSFLKDSSSAVLPARIISNELMGRFMESILFYFDNPAIVTDEILLLKIKELVLLLVQSGHAKTVRELCSALFTRKSITVSEVVSTHIYGDLSVEELATLSGMSITSFKTEFKKTFNESPAAHIRRRKIDRAKELLQVSDYSIGEIAQQVGFPDVSHFTRSFRLLCGTSPTGFRAKVKANYHRSPSI